MNKGSWKGDSNASEKGTLELDLILTSKSRGDRHMCNGLRLRQIRCFVCQLSHAWQHRLSFGSTTIKINCCSSLKNFYPTVYHQLQKNHSFSTKKCPYTDSDRPQRMVLYPRDRFRSCSYKLTLDSFKCIALVTVLQQLLQRTWFILLPQVDLKLLKNTILTGFTHIIFNLYCTKYLRSHWPDLKIEAY